MKISKKTREEAILICAIAGSNHLLLFDVARYFSRRSGEVAKEAFSVAYDAGAVNLSCSYLEAEALLRDGWCPGDPVERLR